MNHPWKAGAPVWEGPSSPKDFRGDLLRGALAKSASGARLAEDAMLGSVAVAAAGIIGGIASEALVNWQLTSSSAGLAILRASLALSAGGLACVALAKRWRASQLAKKSSLAPAVEALDAGFTPQEAIVASLGEKRASKLGGWREAPAPAPSPKKPR